MIIQEMVSRGIYQREVADALGVHPRTVRRALARGGAPAGKRGRPHRSKLDPFKSKVDELLSSGVWNAVVILREIQAQGYAGSWSILRRYIQPKRALRKNRATVRFETEPGKQLQSDWGEIWSIVAGEKTKVHFPVNTLGYSRRFHFWCTDGEDAERTYEGMIRAFEWFGGVIEEVLIDNAKSMVITHRIGEVVRFNSRFIDLASHYGFRPKACRPYRARTKGKDERNVGYVKHNFFARHPSFESFAHMNELAERWLREEADPRVHGTVKEVVSVRFEREAPYLHPLPTVRYDTSYVERRVVSWDGYVDIRGNRYSVAHEWCGSLVTVRIGHEGSISLEAEEKVIARHRMKPAHEGWSTVPAHHEKLWQETLNVECRDLSVYEEVAQCSS